MSIEQGSSSESDSEGQLRNVSRLRTGPVGHSGKAKKGHLVFDAAFESGNLGRVDRINEFEYDLFVRPDIANPRYRFWFNFIIENSYKNQTGYIKRQSKQITELQMLKFLTFRDVGSEKFEIKDQIEWAEAFVIIYSICDRNSFNLADEYLKSIGRIRSTVYVPIILLGNKRDLEVGRQVSLKEGRTLALKFGCQFFEISAADSNLGVSQAFEWLLHQTHKISRSHSENSHSSRSHNHRKLSIVTVSRVFSAFGHVFGRSHSHNDDNNNNDSNGNLNGQKNSTKRLIASVMIPVVRKSTKPTISL